jgi:hypothetical protein
MEMVFSFAVFKTLASALDLEVFTRLSGTKGATSEELARSLGIAERPAEMLLTGCAALGLNNENEPTLPCNGEPILRNVGKRHMLALAIPNVCA